MRAEHLAGKHNARASLRSFLVIGVHALCSLIGVIGWRYAGVSWPDDQDAMFREYLHGHPAAWNSGISCILEPLRASGEFPWVHEMLFLALPYVATIAIAIVTRPGRRSFASCMIWSAAGLLVGLIVYSFASESIAPWLCASDDMGDAPITYLPWRYTIGEYAIGCAIVSLVPTVFWWLAARRAPGELEAKRISHAAQPIFAAVAAGGVVLSMLFMATSQERNGLPLPAAVLVWVAALLAATAFVRALKYSFQLGEDGFIRWGAEPATAVRAYLTSIVFASAAAAAWVASRFL